MKRYIKSSSYVKKISAKEAQLLARKLGIQIGEDGLTFYATNEDESEIFEFDSKRDRDAWVAKYNRKD